VAPETIDQYIAGFPKNVQKILKALRTTIRKAAPKAEETISYGIPTFKLTGPLVYFAAYKKHIGFYPMTADIKAKFKKELAGYEGGKGTVRFPLDRPIPYRLIGRIVKFKVKEDKKK
jgi:uncharacterized protein YdhG (YjbR/CyaY superfamily)